MKMYRFVLNIENVNTCFANGHNSLIVVEKYKVLFDNQIIFEGEGDCFANFSSNDFFRFGDTQNQFLGNLSNNEIQKIDYHCSNDTISTKGVVITKNYRYDEYDKKIKGDYYYLNFIKNEEKLLIKDSEWGFILTFKNETKAIARKLNSLKSLSLETGENLWETDISTYVSLLDGFSYKDERIGGILGVSDNKLIIRVGTRLLMIDLQNGIITGDTEALSHEKNYSAGPAGFHSYLHLEDEYVYLLKRDRYLRIHLITGVLETLWINSQSDLIIEHVHYDENYAYFMACIGWNLQPEVLGVFDRKNLAIVWQYDQPIYSSQPPQSDGKKLYSLDTGGTLHIFERAI